MNGPWVLSIEHVNPFDPSVIKIIEFHDIEGYTSYRLQQWDLNFYNLQRSLRMTPLHSLWPGGTRIELINSHFSSIDCILSCRSQCYIPLFDALVHVLPLNHSHLCSPFL